MGEVGPILLFDGVCNLCTGVTRFVIRRERAPGRFRFAPLQSETARRLLREHGLPTEELTTFVMIDGGRAYVRSTAALRTLKQLGFPWSLAYAGILVPAPIRDVLYRFVARNRYRWFGTRGACLLPTPEIKARFLD